MKNNQNACSVIALKDFHRNNPQSYIFPIDDNKYSVENLWRTTSISFVFNFADRESIDILNNVIVDSRFDGIFSADRSCVEFFYTFASGKEKYENWFNRAFDIQYQGKTYKWALLQPSELGLLQFEKLTTDR